jgi:hypothetical protein
MFFDHRRSGNGPVEDLANLKVSEARVGDALSIAGAAPDFSDLDFTVDRLDVYEAGTKRWIELSGPWREGRVALEVHHDNALTVFGDFNGPKLTLDELGLSEDDLAEMDQRQNPADFFDYKGKFWLYRSSREIGLFSMNCSSSRGFYCWRFQEQDAQRFLDIRKFEGEPFAGVIWTSVNPSDVTVYRGA